MMTGKFPLLKFQFQFTEEAPKIWIGNASALPSHIEHYFSKRNLFLKATNAEWVHFYVRGKRTLAPQVYLETWARFQGGILEH